MNPSEFPNFWRWQIEMTNQDHAILLVAMIAAAALIWIMLIRWQFNRALPGFRVVLVGVYYVALVLAFWGVAH